MLIAFSDVQSSVSRIWALRDNCECCLLHSGAVKFMGESENNQKNWAGNGSWNTTMPSHMAKVEQQFLVEKQTAFIPQPPNSSKEHTLWLLVAPYTKNGASGYTFYNCQRPQTLYASQPVCHTKGGFPCVLPSMVKFSEQVCVPVCVCVCVCVCVGGGGGGQKGVKLNMVLWLASQFSLVISRFTRYSYNAFALATTATHATAVSNTEHITHTTTQSTLQTNNSILKNVWFIMFVYCAQCSTPVSECVSIVLCAVFNAGIGVCVYCPVRSVQRRYRSVCLLSCAQCSTPVSECVYCPVRSVQRRYRSVCLLSCAQCSTPVSECVSIVLFAVFKEHLN
jgi:hypothetical protein